MLIDTDVLIWYLRGNIKAKNVLDKTSSLTISDVTFIELVQGVRNKEELRRIKSFLNNAQIHSLPITAQVSNKACFLIETYSLSHNLRLADALIAATADSYGEILLTGNLNDYKMISSLRLKKFTP